MRKIIAFTAIVAIVIIFANCSGTKKTTSTTSETKVVAPKSTYAANVQTAITTNCSPCHISGKGNKKPYDNFANVKADIDEIIRRIELNPTDRGFMPFRKAAKLSDSTINVFKQWKTDGLLEN